jgi:hypothetical protein
MALSLTIVVWCVPLFDKYWLSDEALDLLNANGWGSFIPNPEFLYWPQLIFWVVISIGLLKRIMVVRTIYLFGLIVFSAVNFGWGFMILSPVEAGLYNLIGILDGAILVISYFTSVANEFKSSPNKASQPAPKSGAAEL